MKVIAVVSLKGGTGKSLMAINVAHYLKTKHKVSVGLIDADLDSSNFSDMVRFDNEIKIADNKKFVLPEWKGIKVFSMSLLGNKKQSISMNADRYVQMLNDVKEQSGWDVDYMVLDMPAGNSDLYKGYLGFFDKDIIGDIIVVQPASATDAYRVIDTHTRFGVPILGLIENMSGYKCAKCDHQADLFGSTVVQKIAKEKNLDVFGKVPVSEEISINVSKGNPILKGPMLDPIKKACDTIINAKPVTESFRKKILDRVGDISRDLIEKVLVEFIIQANQKMQLGKIQTDTGFTEQRPFDLVILDKTGTEVVKRIPMRLSGGVIKVSKTERTPEFEIHTNVQTLARIFMGKMKVGNEEVEYDALGAWFNGEISVYGMGHTTWTFSVLQKIFGNEEIMKEIRNKFGKLLSRFI